MAYHPPMHSSPASADDDLPRRARDALLRLAPEAEAIYLFGSHADGRARADSDLDLAVLDAAPMAPLRRFERQRELSALLGRDVDLVDLYTAGTVLKLEVVTRGERLYRRDADRTLDFEARVLGEYAEFMDATRDLFDAVRERGSVYAQ